MPYRAYVLSTYAFCTKRVMFVRSSMFSPSNPSRFTLLDACPKYINHRKHKVLKPLIVEHVLKTHVAGTISRNIFVVFRTSVTRSFYSFSDISALFFFLSTILQILTNKENLHLFYSYRLKEKKSLQTIHYTDFF